MLEMGARFTNDLYVKVSFDPEEEEGTITLILGSGEDVTINTANFDFGLH